MSHTHTLALMQREMIHNYSNRETVTHNLIHSDIPHKVTHPATITHTKLCLQTDDHGYIITTLNAVTSTGTSGQTVTHTQCYNCSLSQTHTQITQLHLRRPSHRNRLTFMPETDGQSRVQPYSDT